MNTASRSLRLIVAFAFVINLLGARVGSATTSLHLWSKSFTGLGATDNARAVAVDGAGNVFVTGQFMGSFSMGGSALVSTGGNDLFLAKYDANGTHLWSKSFGSATSGDVGYALATDAAGNVYLTGSFTGGVDFGGFVMTSLGSTDIFLVKYDGTGLFQWSSRFGSTGIDEAYGIAVDAAANVYITERFNGTANFGVSLTSTGADDAFLAKYNVNGIYQAAIRFGSSVSDWGTDVAVDAAGNVLVTGIFNGDMSNMGGPTLVHQGNADAFLAKYSSSLTFQWNKGLGSTGYDQGYAVATDASSNVYFAGIFSLGVNFGGGVLNSAGDTDAVLAKYNAAGVHQWSQRFGGTLDDRAYALAVDAIGRPTIAGYFRNTADFGNGNVTAAGGTDGFVAKYRSNGAPTWSRALGGAGADVAYSVATGPTSTVHVTGGFTGTVNLGGSNLVSSGGTEDAFLAKYGADAIEPLISSITDIGNDQGRQVKVAFFRSAHDDPTSGTPIIRYEAYRRTKAAPAALSGDLPQLSPRDLMIQGWTEVGITYGHGESEYSMDVPTIGDSTIALGQYYSNFFVRAATNNTFSFFDSPPDSGYSVDNLAPGIPGSFVFTSGNLAWDESKDKDFDYFTVYGSNTNSFGNATVVNYSVAPAMNVSGSPYAYYFVTATDFSGNEGKPAIVNTLSNVGGTPSSYVLSVSNYPNPFNPRTTVSYTVPSRGTVTVLIYDARGARVRTLLKEDKDAGAYSMEWDGRADKGGAVASGIYFAHIEHNGVTRTKKMVLLK